MSAADLPPVYQDIPELRTMLLDNVRQTGRQLGIGSFGVVNELKYGGTICAGKKLHDNLMDYRDEGVQQLIRRFVSECCLMSELRHPNIVQFLGLAFQKAHRHPILVMERLDVSLDALLEEEHNLTLEVRYKILLDVAKGLEYLHNREFPVIHRDLTTRNVLLNRTTLHAKICDMGNALLVEQKKFTRTLSRNPGTTVYMPPEATGYAPNYDASLDMFSFGQLALYAVIQVFPGDLLPATFCDPVTEVVTGRSELERRREYIDMLDTTLQLQHPLNVAIRLCLSNLPSKRPRATQMIDIIDKLLTDSEESTSTSLTSKEEPEENLDTNGVTSTCDEPVQDAVAKEIMQSIMNGELRLLDMRLPNLSQPTQVWRPCFFQLLLASNSVKYSFDEKMNNDVRSIDCSEIINVASVLTTGSSDLTDLEEESGEKYFYFFIYHKGKDSPLQLRTMSSYERSCWTEALSFHMHDNASYEEIGHVEHDDSAKLDRDSPMQPHLPDYTGYQQLDPTTMSRHEAAFLKLPVDTINLDNLPEFHQLDPSQLQLLLLVKMQKMLTELQKEISNSQQMATIPPSMQKQEEVSAKEASEEVLQEDETVTDPQVLDKDQVDYYSGETLDSCSAVPDKHIVYSDLCFTSDYENTSSSENTKLASNAISNTMSVQKMKNVLGDLLLNTNPTDKMLVTDDDNVYYPRPPWAKAGTKPGTDLDSLDALHQETLFLSESSVSHLEPLGEGQFGIVHKADLQKDFGSVPVAVKTIKKYTESQEIENFLREQAVMAKMIHPNVVRLYGLIKRGSQSPWMILEYLPNGNLCQFLAVNHRPVNTLVKYMLDVAVGMHYISEKGLIHRDLAARNIMVGRNEICKVGDFGLLRELPKHASIYVSTSTNALFPVRWMAPESLEDREFSPATDVWSFGIVLWEMVNPGAKPYGDDINELECGLRVIGGHKLQIPTVYPSTVQRIMKACWHNDPSKRPSFLLISSLLTNLTFGTV